MNVQFLRAAQRDLREAVEYYEARRAGLGATFRDEVLKAVEQIKAFPEACRALSANTRRCRMRRFPYGVIYQADAAEIIIVAIANLRRDPAHWQDRV